MGWSVIDTQTNQTVGTPIETVDPIPIAIAINIILGQTVSAALKVPIYLDSIGTILVGVLAVLAQLTDRGGGTAEAATNLDGRPEHQARAEAENLAVAAAESVILARFRADGAVVAEPTGLAVMPAHRGFGRRYVAGR